MNGLLKMSELAEASGVSVGTIKHYLREGLLGNGDEIVRTSRNMAYYPPEFVERIRLIKKLPGGAVHAAEGHPRGDPGEGDRRGGRRAAFRAEVRRRYDVPDNVLRRLAEIGVLTPAAATSSATTWRSSRRWRASAPGATTSRWASVYDTDRYREALQPLVEEEVEVALSRLAGLGRARSRSSPPALRRCAI